MKIVLSRKGFDSSYGECASPIFPDGTMLSMPIPSHQDSGTKFSDIKYSGYTYDEIWKRLGKNKYITNSFCHLDPDIRKGIKKRPPKWEAAFGQENTAETHLENNNIKEGDIFLFFGRYNFLKENEMEYEESDDFHAIYGFLQIGEIVRGEDIKKYNWHPHSKPYFAKNNTLYLASKRLCIDGDNTELPGFGTFKYSQDLKLSTDNDNKLTHWKKLPWMDQCDMTYHRGKKYSERLGYFQVASRGQEFVIDESNEATNWAINIIKKHIEQ